MFRVALKDLLARKRRLVTTSIAIVLGIAFLTGTQLLSSTLSDSIKSLVGDVYQGIDAVVRSPDTQETPFGQPIRNPVPASLTPEVAAVTGVRDAQGVVESTGPELVDSKGKVYGGGFGPPTITYNWLTDEALRLGKLTDGRGPEADDEVAVDFKTADGLGVEVGGEITLATTQQGTETFTLVGLVGLGEDGTQSSGAKVMFFTTPTAQRLVNQPDQFNYVAVAAEPGVTQTALAKDLADALPNQQVLTGAAFTEENQEQISQFVDILGTFISVFGYIALFVAIFIIYNTFSIIVQQRSRETALLRAVGARRRQVLGATMLEALLIGLIASVLGLLFGVALAAALISLVKNFFTVNSGVPGLTGGVVVLALVIGVGVTILSAFIPALRSSKIPPIAALSEVSLDRSGLSTARKVWGGLLVLGGIALMAAGLADAGPNPLLEVGAGAVALLVSVAVILGPLIASPVSRLLAKPFSIGGRITGRLGGRERRPQPPPDRRHRRCAHHRGHPGGGDRHRGVVHQGHGGRHHQRVGQGRLRGGHGIGHLVRVHPGGHRGQDRRAPRRRPGQPRPLLLHPPAGRQGPGRRGERHRHHHPRRPGRRVGRARRPVRTTSPWASTPPPGST